MFHCNGWTYTWAVTAAGGTHVCLRRVEPAAIFDAIAAHRVTHLCGAPIVLNMLVHAPAEQRNAFAQRVEAATGGAAPPSAVHRGDGGAGLRRDASLRPDRELRPGDHLRRAAGWADLPLAERAAADGAPGRGATRRWTSCVRRRSRDHASRCRATGRRSARSVLRGNTVMKGYLKNPAATAEAFAGGWFRTGDLAVWHPDGYVEVKDRSKDIIISGGENISSLEVEEVLYRHPAVMEAAVVAQPGPEMGRDAPAPSSR